MPVDPIPAATDLELSGEQFADLIGEVTARLREHIDSLPDQPSWNTEHFEQVVDSYDLEIGRGERSFTELMDYLFETAIPCSFNTASPGYLAYIPAGGLLQSAAADLISTATNRYMGVWAAAPLLANIEQAVIRWFCQLFGLPDSSGGILTSGGSLANWTAMVAARTRLLGEEFLDGVLYCSDQAHHCVEKAARLCGIKRANVKLIGTDDQFRMDVAQLEAEIEKDKAAGLRPFFVAANAGSTNSGAVDPLEELAQVCQESGIWLHVDAAYGGFFVMTERGRRTLKGIDQADSIVIDPHKSLFLPYGTGALVVRSVKDLSDANRIDADYMPDYQDDQDKTDFHEISPELSREFRGLRVWLPLQMHGAQAFEDNLNEKLDLTDWIYERLKNLNSPRSSVEIVAEPQLSIFAFRVRFQCDDHLLDDWNRELMKRVNARKRVYLTGTLLNGQFVIRICVLSFRTHLDRIKECYAAIVEEIGDIEKILLQQRQGTVS